ncbi:MAG: hypothetical protein ACOYMX_06290, partial [Burkholderiales bacterium]
MTRTLSAILSLAAWPLLTLLLTFSPAPVSAADEANGPDTVPLNRIIALVNREIVTRLELEDRIAIAVDQLRKQGVALPP